MTIERILREMLSSIVDATGKVSHKHLDGTLEGEFANQFDALTSQINEVGDCLDLPLPILAVFPTGAATQDYNSFKVDEVRRVVKMFDSEMTQFSDNLLKVHRFINTTYKQLRDEKLRSIKFYKRNKLNVDFGDGLEDFRKKNLHARRMPDSYVREILSDYADMEALISSYTTVAGQICRARDLLAEGKDMAMYLDNALDLIKELKSHPEIRKAEADLHLAHLIRGEISASAARKRIFARPETASQPAANGQAPTPWVKGHGEHKTYDRRELSYLESRGIKGFLAKDLLGRQNYQEIKGFIKSLDNLFKNRSLSTKEASIIIQKNHHLLSMDSAGFSTYVGLVDDLFNLRDPKVASGILPRHSPELYASTEALASYLAAKASRVDNLSIAGLEKVTNDSDRELLESKLRATPFAGMPIKKYVGGINTKKTAMYETYSKIAGEGHYRKVPFGKRRAVIKVANESNGNYKVDVIEYFDTHEAYSRFLQVRR